MHLSRKCSQELLRDRFVAGLTNERLRERLLMEPDNLTVETAIQLSQNFERPKTESEGFSSSHHQSDSVQALVEKNQQQNSRFRKYSPSPSRFRSNSKYRNSSGKKPKVVSVTQYRGPWKFVWKLGKQIPYTDADMPS